MSKNMVPVISVEKLTVLYRDVPALLDVTVQIASGSLLAVIGPNGAGKTTFIKSIVGLINPVAGAVAIDGGAFNEHRQRVAYVPQRMSVDWDFPINVYDVVMMGRYGKLGWLRRPGNVDRQIVLESLARVGLTDYTDRSIGCLSGGQQQRVFFARALAQQADIYLFDEPFVNIDGATEYMLVRLLQDIAHSGKTVVVVHHDLYTVRTYFDTALLLNVKKIAYGPVDQVVTAAYVDMAYGNRYLAAYGKRDQDGDHTDTQRGALWG